MRADFLPAAEKMSDRRLSAPIRCPRWLFAVGCITAGTFIGIGIADTVTRSQRQPLPTLTMATGAEYQGAWK